MPALLHLRSVVAGDADAAAFARWCDRHHEELLQVEGFRTARRYELVGGRPGRDLLTLYDLDDLTVLDGEGYARHGRDHTPLPPVLATALRFERSTWTRVAGGDATAAAFLVRYEGDGPGRRFLDGSGAALTLLATDDPASLLDDGPRATAWRLVFAAP